MICKNEHNHQTREEISFINSLGNGTNNSTAGISRSTMLSQYLVGCAKRYAWCEIDRFSVINHAKEELESALEQEKNII